MIDAGSLKGAWRSERLMYRAIENNEKDTAFVFGLSADPTNVGMSAPFLLRPPTTKSVQDFMGSFLNGPATLFSALMCLPPMSEGDQPTPIGLINLCRALPGAEHHRNAIVGLGIVEDSRGKGYGKEAINFILDFAFRQANLHRVGIKVFSYNHVALDLYKKLGFVEEGRERENHYFDCQYHDTILLSMLDHEWVSRRRPDQS